MGNSAAVRGPAAPGTEPNESELPKLRALGRHPPSAGGALQSLPEPDGPDRARTEITYSQFRNDTTDGRVKSVVISGQEITGKYEDGSRFRTVAPENADYVTLLEDAACRSRRAQDDEKMSFLSVLVSWFPMFLLIAVWIFFMRQMQGAGGRAMGFGKSKAKLLTEAHGRVTFDDVAGVDEAKEDLEEIVEFLRDPQKFQRLGGRIPRGVLLVGPPGTGKTLLARAIAGEANVPFFTISGSDFVEMFVGVGASPRARHVRAGEEERALHHLHRRDRRRRPASRRRPRRRQRRARADAEPAARRDGRLRGERRHHPDRRHQPARRARPGAAAPRPLRPADRGAEPRRGRAREDPEGACAQGAAGAGRQPEDHRARHAGLLRRRPDEPRQRGGAARGAARQAARHDARVRGRQGQGHDGRRAAHPRHDRGREAAHRLSRGRPRHRRAARPLHRPGPQGDDHPARPRARHGHAAAGARPALDDLRADDLAPRHPDGRARCGGAGLRRAARSPPARPPTSSRRPSSPAPW